MTDENGYFAALGVEPAGEPAAETESAGGESTDTADESWQDAARKETPETADGAETKSNPAADSGAGDEPPAQESDASDKSDSSAGKQEQSAEERKANAARRRKAELQAAVDQARTEEREAAQAREAEFFRSSGLVDPETGKPIETMDDFKRFRDGAAERQRQQREAKIAGGKATPEDFRAAMREAIDSHPAVRAAEEAAKAAREAKLQAERERIDAKTADAVAEIGRINPEIKSITDILAMETGDKFRGYIRKGLTIQEAYELANHTAIEKQKAEAARRETRNLIAGKDHLQPVTARGQGGAAIPPEEMRYLKNLFPRESEENIRKLYAKIAEK